MLADRTLTMCAGDVAKNIVAFNRSSCDWRRLRFAWLYCRASFSLLKQGGCYEISYAYFVGRRGRQCHRSIRQTRSSRSIHFGRAKARGGVLHGRRGGQRGGIIVVNVSDVSQIPALAEPWFLTANAKVEFIPAMTPEDLAKAGPSIEAAIKKYAS
jgi:hypothetical protein